MAADIARAAHGNAATNYSVTGAIPVVTANQIESIVASYTSGDGHATPDTAAELRLILPGVASPGPTDAVHEKDDVFFTDDDGFENHIEIKTPKPNYDQGRASKRRILRILAARSTVDVRAFVGMPYNPNGYLGEYSWPTTKYMIDMSTDLKVGREFWNFVGNSDDTYDELLDCFLEVANARKPDLLELLREV